MSSSLVEKSIRCPYCGERIALLLDPSGGGDTYIEDCQVCCQPMQVGFEIEDGEVQRIRVERAG